MGLVAYELIMGHVAPSVKACNSNLLTSPLDQLNLGGSGDAAATAKSEPSLSGFFDTVGADCRPAEVAGGSHPSDREPTVGLAGLDDGGLDGSRKVGGLECCELFGSALG
jgi:hypothetical protein